MPMNSNCSDVSGKLRRRRGCRAGGDAPDRRNFRRRRLSCGTPTRRGGGDARGFAVAVPDGGEQAAELDEEQRTISDARRARTGEAAMARLHSEAKEQLPMLRDRLRRRGELEASAPEKAAAMYRALIDLYGDEAVGGSRDQSKRAR